MIFTLDTTSIGENIIFRPSANWRKDAKEEKTDTGNLKEKLKDKQVKCRICNGEHFTARCPYKGTIAPVGEETGGDAAASGAADLGEGPGGLSSGKGSYVPPHLRGAQEGSGDRMGGGKYERDDLATLRVTNVSSRLYTIPLSRMMLIYNSHRSQKWQKSKSLEICSSGSAASQGSSWPRIERRDSRRALRSSVFRSAQTRPGRARRWTVTASSISFYGWSLRRRLPRCIYSVQLGEGNENCKTVCFMSMIISAFVKHCRHPIARICGQDMPQLGEIK